MRYDAWPSPTDLNHNVLDPRVTATFETDWNSRTPALGWSMYGTGIDAQAHAEATNAYAIANGIDAWAFLVHLPRAIYGGTPDELPYVEDVQIPFEKYLTSSNKAGVKFILMLNCPFLRHPYTGSPNKPTENTSGGAYLNQWGAWVASQFDDPQYLKINGVPVLGIFGASGISTTMWSTFTAALNRPFLGVAWDHDIGNAPGHNATVLTEYPPSPAVITGNGQHPYSDIISQDDLYSTPAGFLTTALVTASQDERPLNATGIDAVVPWADQPTQPQLVSHIYRMGTVVKSNVKPQFMSLHAWNEHAEDGWGWEPTNQDGDRKIRAVKWAKHPELRPTTETYGLSTESNQLVKTGAGWSMVRILNSPVWANREMVDSTAGDTIALTHVAQTAGAIYGSKCVGCGSFTVQLDGSTVATVSTSAGSLAQHQLLWSSGTLTENQHTTQATIVGDGPVHLDEFEITANPLHYPL